MWAIVTIAAIYCMISLTISCSAQCDSFPQLTCQCVHDAQLRGGGDPGDHEGQEDGDQARGEDAREELHPGVGHLGNDQAAADVGEHRAGQVEHAPGVHVENVVGGGQHPDEEHHHRHGGRHQRPQRLAQTSILARPLNSFVVLKLHAHYLSLSHINV